MKDNPVFNISKRFTFDAAHHLTGVQEDHPCGKLHGHTYTVEVEVRGTKDLKTGWVIDYSEIKEAVKPLVNQLDHSYLNDIEDLKFTTAEELSVWFWERVKPRLENLYRISMIETPTSRCDFYGEYHD